MLERLVAIAVALLVLITDIDFVDEILAGLQHAQELYEFAARGPQIVPCPFSLINQLTPFIGEVLVFLPREPGFLLERPQLLAGVA